MSPQSEQDFHDLGTLVAAIISAADQVGIIKDTGQPFTIPQLLLLLEDITNEALK